MRAPSGRMFPDVVTVTTKSWSNVKGARVATPATVTLAASAQPMSAQRRVLYSLDAGVTAWTVYFASDPAVNAADTITLPSGRTLSVLAPARDAAGRGAVWAVDCTERS